MSAWLPPENAAVPCTAPLTCGSNLRSSQLLLDVVSQFKVETAERYRKKDNKTFCNIFVSDVTKSMSSEVPHWWLGGELSANRTMWWFRIHGKDNGWSETDEMTGRANALVGRPVVAIWANPDSSKSGHIAILVPPRFANETDIAQAGKTNFSRGSIWSGFTRSMKVRFFVHA